MHNYDAGLVDVEAGVFGGGPAAQNDDEELLQCKVN